MGMYEEGKEALFWEDTDECVAMCQYALRDEERRLAIAAAGRTRNLANGYFNEPTLKLIIEKALSACMRDPARKRQ
jgi:hypothetical protein